MVNAIHRAKFTLLADVFIHQLSKFYTLQAQRVDINQSIICKPKLNSTHILFYKDQTVCSYFAKWLHDIAKKEILSIIRSKTLRYESS